MAIRVQHNYGGGLAGGAFGAGRNRGRQRRRKYALDLEREQRQLMQRRQTLFMDRALRGLGGGVRGGARGAAGGAAAGRWEDPAVGFKGTPLEFAREKKAWDRKRRLGEVSGPSPYEPRFIPDDPDADERALEIADRDEGRAHDAGLLEEKIARESAEEAAELRRKARVDGEARFREDIEEGKFSEEDARTGKEILRQINAVRGSGRFTDEGKRAAELDELYRQLEEVGARRTEGPTRDDRLRKQIGDAAFDKYGDLLWSEDDGKFTLMEDLPEVAEKAAKEEAEKREADRRKYITDHIGKQRPGKEPSPANVYTLDDVQELDEEWRKLQEGLTPIEHSTPESIGGPAGGAVESRVADVPALSKGPALEGGTIPGALPGEPGGGGFSDPSDLLKVAEEAATLPTPEEFDKAFADAPVGAKIVGPDGVMYEKTEE